MAETLARLALRCRMQPFAACIPISQMFQHQQSRQLTSLYDFRAQSISLPSAAARSQWAVPDAHTPGQASAAAWCSAAGVRSFAAGTQDQAPATLQRRMRELLMLVHPDRWAHDAVAQQENERSFKLLQEYLEAVKAVGRPLLRIIMVILAWRLTG